MKINVIYLLLLILMSSCFTQKHSYNISLSRVYGKYIELENQRGYYPGRGIALGDNAQYCIDTIIINNNNIAIYVKSTGLIADQKNPELGPSRISFSSFVGLAVYTCVKKSNIYYPKNLVGVSSNSGELIINASKYVNKADSSFFILMKDTVEFDQNVDLVRIVPDKKNKFSFIKCSAYRID